MIVAPSTSFTKRTIGMKADFVFVDCAPHDTRKGLLEHSLALSEIVGFHDCHESGPVQFGCKYTKAFNGIIQTAFVSNTIDLSGIELE